MKHPRGTSKSLSRSAPNRFGARLGRSLVATLLAVLARAVLRRYKPRVVMVTGSVGKTSTKDAVALALATRFLVRKSEKSMNSEFGVPFTVFGVGNPWSDPLAWVQVLLRALALLLLPNHYPGLLVLEVGADHPGDLAKILKIARPNAVVVTALPETPVHVEFYDSPGAVREEEFSPALALPAGAPLVVCADDRYALKLAAGTGAKVTTYGLAEGASVRLADTRFLQEGGKIVGMQGVLIAGEERSPVSIHDAVGKTQLLPLAAAAAAAAAFNIPLEEAAVALAAYEAPPGRGRVIAGVKGSTIIDDSYNASPPAVAEALENLKAMPATRRIAVLGDMLELGRYSVVEHERIGERARGAADLLITVGIRSKGMMGNESFDDSTAAAKALPALVETGDVILVKGSQSIRTERIVAALLADPADISKLARQDPAWQKR